MSVGKGEGWECFCAALQVCVEISCLMGKPCGFSAVFFHFHPITTIYHVIPTKR